MQQIQLSVHSEPEQRHALCLDTPASNLLPSTPPPRPYPHPYLCYPFQETSPDTQGDFSCPPTPQLWAVLLFLGVEYSHPQMFNNPPSQLSLPWVISGSVPFTSPTV